MSQNVAKLLHAATLTAATVPHCYNSIFNNTFKFAYVRECVSMAVRLCANVTNVSCSCQTFATHRNARLHAHTSKCGNVCVCELPTQASTTIFYTYIYVSVCVCGASFRLSGNKGLKGLKVRCCCCIFRVARHHTKTHTCTYRYVWIYILNAYHHPNVCIYIQRAL